MKPPNEYFARQFSSTYCRTVLAHRLYSTATFSSMFAVKKLCCIVQHTWAISCGKLKVYPPISSQPKTSEEREMNMSGCNSENWHVVEMTTEALMGPEGALRVRVMYGNAGGCQAQHLPFICTAQHDRICR
jgi:hypothetical protein